MEMSGEDLFRNIKHEDLKLYFGDTFSNSTKKEMIERILQLFASNESAKKAFYERFAKEIALHPTDLEKVLQCTNPERVRWTEEGKLRVRCTVPFRKGKNVYQSPMFDREFIEQLSEETIEQWRFEHEQQKAINRKRGAQQARSTRIANKEIRDEFDEEFNARIERWNAIDQGLAATLSLCYWTMWISRWAKEYTLLKRKKTDKQNEYMEKESSLYELKANALRLLVGNPYAHISFYQPKKKDKPTIEFCMDHRRECSDSGLGKLDYYKSNQDEIDGCCDCEVDIDTHYYSLFYLRVCDERIPDDSFSFHIPYSEGSCFFPDPKELPKVEHKENEFGNFRFGREIRGDEEIGRREKDVVERFNDAYQNYLTYFPQR